MQNKLQMAAGHLLMKLAKEREENIIQTWRGSETIDQRETAWLALRELDLLAGAIENDIRNSSN